MTQHDVPTSDLVVTLWETYGAGMEEIGALVAADLGVELHQQAYTTAEVAAAGRSGRIGRGEDEVWFLVGATGKSPHGFLRSEVLRGVHEQNRRIAATLVEDVQAEAARGAVIMGRNGTHILRDWPNALHVKLDGPVRDRIARAAAAEGISPAEAKEREYWIDEVRSQIALELFDWDPRENTWYDLVFNTSNLAPATCARLIADAARYKAHQAAKATTRSPTDSSPTDPSPTDPSPTDPSPTDPSPTDPNPTSSEDMP